MVMYAMYAVYHMVMYDADKDDNDDDDDDGNCDGDDNENDDDDGTTLYYFVVLCNAL